MQKVIKIKTVGDLIALLSPLDRNTDVFVSGVDGPKVHVGGIVSHHGDNSVTLLVVDWLGYNVAIERVDCDG